MQSSLPAGGGGRPAEIMDSKILAPRPFRNGEVIRHAERDEYGKILDLLRLAFPQVPSKFFETMVLSDPDYDPRYSLVIEQDGHFRSHLQIYARTMVINSRSVRFGGIGNVGTPPAYRRCGYGTALLLHAIDLMKKERFEGSLLFTDIGDFYAKLRWVPIHRRLIELAVFTSGHSISPGVLLTRMKPEHLDGIRELAESFHTNRTGRIVRGENYWSRARPWAEERGWLVLRGGSIVGFFFCLPHKDRTLLISEYAYRPGLNGLPPSDFFAMLQEIAAREGNMHILGNFLFEPEIRAYLESSTLAFRERTDSFMMWRDLGQRKYSKQLETAARGGTLLFWETDAF